MTEKRSLYEMPRRSRCLYPTFRRVWISAFSTDGPTTEEVGELAREVNHHYGEKAKKKTEVEKTVAEETR